MIRSVRARFTLWFIASLLLLFVIASGVSELFFLRHTLRILDERLLESSALIETQISACAPEAQGEAFQERFEALLHSAFPFDLVFAQLFKAPESDAHSPVLLASASSFPTATLALPDITHQGREADTQFIETAILEPFHIKFRVLTRRIQPAGCPAAILQFATVIDPKTAPSSLHQTFEDSGHVFSVTFFILLLFTPLFGYVFMKRAFAPIHTLVKSARNITAEDLSHRIEAVNSWDEIGELADTFNEMIERLDRSFKHVQQFSGDVAHELKTPLTALKGEVEVALRKDRSPQEYRSILASVLENTDKLSHIVEDLLFLARLDARTLSVMRDRVALDGVLLEIYEITSTLAKKKQITLNLQTLDPVEIAGDTGLIMRLLINLVTNAIQYTPPGGDVDLALEASENEANVTVRDTGIGIPEHALPHLFNRFYRVDQARSHGTGGSGLGLAIARKIAEAHDARITVESRVGKGTTFTVCWKR